MISDVIGTIFSTQGDTKVKLRTAVLLVVFLLGACASNETYDRYRINNQADADAYNAQVTNEAEKLICSREKIMGSIRTRFVCMTAGQRRAAQAELVDIRTRGAVLPTR